MEIKEYVKLEQLSKRIHELGHECGLHVELPNEYEIHTIDNAKMIVIELPNVFIFYKLLLEDLADDVAISIKEDYYKLVFVKYIDEELGKNIRNKNKKKLEHFSAKNALVIQTNTLCYKLMQDKIENESFLKDFYKHDNMYIKTFDSIDSRFEYILSIDNPYRVLLMICDVLINGDDIILL